MPLFDRLRRLLGPSVASVSARDAYQRLGTAVMLDVRQHHEFRGGHIHGAVHIPLGELRHRMSELDRERAVITVCRSGNRSARAARVLAREGYEVANLRGGMMAWAAERLPVRTVKSRR